MSHIARINVDAPLSEGVLIPLDDGQGKYLTRVMRLADGAVIRVFDGQTGEWHARLQVEGKRVSLKVNQNVRPYESVPDLTLFFAPIKKARTDFIVEKATELGVRTIQPIMTEYTQASRVRTDRLRLLAIEAAEQTERLDLPQIHESTDLFKALSYWDQDRPIYYCDESGGAKPLLETLSQAENHSAGILIGPEGGFSPREREKLRALEFVIPVTLGPRILRAETAVVSALTLWQSQLGDWQNQPYLPES